MVYDIYYTNGTRDLSKWFEISQPRPVRSPFISSDCRPSPGLCRARPMGPWASPARDEHCSSQTHHGRPHFTVRYYTHTESHHTNALAIGIKSPVNSRPPTKTAAWFRPPCLRRKPNGSNGRKCKQTWQSPCAPRSVRWLVNANLAESGQYEGFLYFIKESKGI